MIRGLMLALVCLGIIALTLTHCGSTKAGAGDFCNTASDCKSPLICENNICVKGSSSDCNPPCQQEFETCFQGSCVPFGDPNDKDGDGSQVGADCDDFDPQVHPEAFEYCDGLDNNCDGLIDEGCTDCDDGSVQPCFTDLGECIAGVQNCAQGEWDACSGNGPTPELCDGLDNDCDGLTDETCPCQNGDEFPCGAQMGICATGVQTCSEGEWSGCHNGELPRQELCNDLDDDCDGATDDGFNLEVPCIGDGECGEGLVECAADLDVRCSTMPGGSADQSIAELCDSLDNDCDGLTDEGLDADVAPNTCALASELGGLPDNTPGGSRVTALGNLWPPGDEDWYKVTASDDLAEDLEDECDSFHFAVRFDQNPANAVLDIYRDSCAPEEIECREADSFNHYYDYNEMQAGQPVGQCGCRGQDAETSEEGFNICSSETKTFFIRVHAGPDPIESCENYQLTFSNGVPVPVE